MAYFADYIWSKGEPRGVSPLEDPVGVEHYRLLEVDGGVRVEQFDGDGKFARLVFCPQDEQFAGTTYETSADHRHRVRRGPDGAVRFYEEYTWPGGVYADDVYPQVKVFNADGRFIAEHRPERLAEDAWDIHVFDGLGKPKVILHHTDVDGTEPCTIAEEWLE